MKSGYDRLKNKLHPKREEDKTAVNSNRQSPTNNTDGSSTKEAEQSHSGPPQTDESQDNSLGDKKSTDSLEAALKKLQIRNPWDEAYSAIQTDHPDLFNAYTQALLEWGAYTGDKNLHMKRKLQDVAQNQLEVWQSERFRFSFNGKDIVIGEKVQKIVKAVLSVKDVVSAAVSAEPHAALAWAGVLVVLPVVANALQQDSDAMSGFDYISDLLVRYRYVEEDEYYKEGMTSASSFEKVNLLSLIQKKFVDLYRQVYIYQLRVVKHFRHQKAGRYLENLKDSLGEESWSKSVENLKMASNELDEDLKHLTNGMVFKIGSKVDDFSKTTQGILEELKTQNRLMTEHRDRILRAFKSSANAPFDSSKNADKPKCLDKTQVGTLEMIQRWCNGDEKTILWLHGMAGTGKSTIARTIAWALRDRQWPDDSSVEASIRLGGSFFFDRLDPECNTSQYLFPTLAKCLAETVPDIRQYIIDAVDQDARIEEKGLRDQWATLISGPLRKLNASSKPCWRFIIVIDCLDECEEKDKIETVLKLVTSLHDVTSIRFLLTSRPETHIRYAFQGLPQGTYDPRPLDKIAPERDDITRFFQVELERITTKYNIKGWPGQENIEKLNEKSDGLFVYASTCCRFLDNPHRYRKRLENILKDDSEANTPQGELDGVYSKIINMSLDGTTDSERKEMLEDFRLIVGAIMLIFKPTSAATLGAFLFPSDQDYKARIQGCIEPLSSLLDAQTENDPIHPLHLSFREFLLSRERCKNTPDLFINLKESHLILFQRCMETMQSLKQNMGDFVLPGSSPSEIPSERLEDFLPPALSYSCRYWIDHLMQLGIDKQNELLNEDQGTVECFLQKKLLFWFEALSLMGEVEAGVSQLENLQEVSKHCRLSTFVRDARRFLLHNRHIIEQAPLQIYSSALIFSPMNSLTKENYLHLAPAWITQRPVMEQSWSRELIAIETPGNYILSNVFSPDGNIGASLSYNENNHYHLMLWSAKTGRVKFQTKEVTGGAVDFSQDGKLLAHRSEDGRVRLWKFETDESFFVGEAEISSISFSPDGKFLVFIRQHSVEVWQHQPCQRISAFVIPFQDGSFYPCEARFLYNGKVVVAYLGKLPGISNWKIYLFDPCGTAPRLIEQGEYDADFGMRFSISKNGDRLLISRGNIVQIWDAKTELLSSETVMCGDILVECIAAAISADGNLFATASTDYTIRVWNSTTHRLISSFQWDKSVVITMAFHPEYSILGSGSMDGTVRLWDIEPDPRRDEIMDTQNKLRYPFGIEVLTGTKDAATVLRNMNTGRCRSYNEPFHSIEFLSQGNVIALRLGQNMTPRPFPAAHLLSINLELQSPKFEHVENIVPSPNGRRLAILGQQTVWILDAQLSEETEIAMEGLKSFQFSPDSRFAGLTFSRSVEIWDLEDKKDLMWSLDLSNRPTIGFSQKADAVAIWVRGDQDLAGGFSSFEIWELKPVPHQQLIEYVKLNYTRHNTGAIVYSQSGDYVAMQALQYGEDDASHLVLFVYEMATRSMKSFICTTRRFSLDGPIAVWSDMIAMAPKKVHDRNMLVVVNCRTGERICTLESSVRYPFGHALSFSGDGRYLNLDRGQVPIPVGNCPPTIEAYPSSSLWVGEEWIFHRGRKLIWLPAIFRKCRATVKNGTIWLYLDTGSIVVFKIDLEKTPLATEVLPEGGGFIYDEQERVMVLD